MFLLNPATPTPTPPPTPTPTQTPTPTPTATPTIQVTIQTNPVGRSFTVDGTTYGTTKTLSWQAGSSHTKATISPQSGGTGVQYAWKSWSDNGSISHTVAPTTNKTYTANFTTQYYLTLVAGSGEKVSPSSGWKNRGAAISITATPPLVTLSAIGLGAGLAPMLDQRIQAQSRWVDRLPKRRLLRTN